MKRQIPIFVAGSKSFRPQRLSLKAMANDLNNEFQEQNRGVNVLMCSYENFGDDQKEYNQFIENVAQLVIFVLDGQIGEHTRDEFMRAAAKYNKEGEPKIIVFLRDFENKTQGIQHIEDLLAEQLGTNFYYNTYTSTEDLCTKAKERIRQHVQRVIRRRNIFRQSVWLLLLTLLFVAGFTTMRWFAFDRATVTPEPTLLFVGGGSAANYLRDHHIIDVSNTKLKSLYLNMPSGQGYLIMADEVFENHTRKNNPTENNCFYPICLSASEAKAKDFADSNVFDEEKEFSDKGIIISCFIGYDTLEAHFFFNAADDMAPLPETDILQAEELERLLRTEQSMKIFTTRKQSGTYKAFSENMHCYPDSLESDRRGIFYSATETNSLVNDVKGRKGYVLLGSRAYTPTRWKEFSEANKDTYRTYAVALGDSVICKPICLYLAAFKEPDGNYSIPPVARDFLRDVLNKQGVTDKLQLKNIDQGQIVRPLEDFLFVE